MESAVLDFLGEVYNFLYEDVIDTFEDVPLVKGILLVLLWAIIIGVGIGFIYSFWYNWVISVSILGSAIVIEILVAIGKHF